MGSLQAVRAVSTGTTRALLSALLFTAVSMTLAACASKDEPRCLTNADCPRGACVAGACQLEDDDTGGQTDAPPDAPPDSDQDTPPDTLPDTEPDTRPDTQEDVDVLPDTRPDADPDADADSDADADPDVVLDVLPDAELDAEPDGDADVPPDGGCETTNACGGCTVLDAELGDPCGSCGLDEYQCDGTDALLCTGDTACDSPGVTMTGVTEVTLTSARFEGTIPSLGEDGTATAHGFCWSSRGTPSPIASGTVCQDLGSLEEPASFWYNVGELTPGTLWRVRAFVDAEGELLLSNEIAFWTPPSQVTGVVADAGVAPDVVNVSWSAVEGAAGYFVYRARLPEEGPAVVADVSEAWFQDTTVATAEGPTLGDDAVRASRDVPGRVVVEWDAAISTPGPQHSYFVVAYNEGGEAVPSEPSIGYTAGLPILAYEVRAGDGEWVLLDPDAQSYVDTAALVGSITPGAARASDGESGVFVALSVAGVTTSPGAVRTYSVRAINAAGPSAERASDGQAAVGPLYYQWLRTTSDAQTGTYTALAGAETATFEDTTAPAPGVVADGEGRWYRVEVSAAGIAPVTSSPDRGYRANVGPPVTTLETTGITNTQATLRGQIGMVLVPRGVTQHGFCYGTSPQPGLADGTSTCQELGGSDYNRQFDYAVSGLLAGTTYHVRAFAQDSSGLAYGGNVTFVTVPRQPVDVSATDGSSSAGVTITWAPVPGASSYEVFRDSTRIATGVNGTSYLDTTAPAGSPPAGASLNLTASQGTFPQFVRLTWDLTASGAPGPTASYTVAARNAAGGSVVSAPDTGYRGAPAVTGYQILVAGGPTVDVGATGVYDDTTAPAGMIDPGLVEVSQGTDLDAVVGALLRESKTDGAPVSYRIRAVSAEGPGASSDSVTGRRGVGPLQYQWYRLLESGIGALVPLEGATQATLTDPTAPWAPDAANYLVEISAAGATTVRTDTARGWRQRPAVISIQGGRAHTCLLLNNGEVRCFGDNQYGQLGLGRAGNVGDTGSDLPPMPVLLGGRATGLTVGDHHACATLDKGGVRCWGRNNRGQLGTGDTNNRGLTPESMPPPEVLPRATSIAAGAAHTCAAANGNLFCWGDNTFGQVGIAASTTIVSTPREIEALSGVYSFVAAGARHTWAAGPLADFTCWGANDYGQCLRATTQDVVLPRAEGFPPTQVVTLATGGDTVCAILASGALGTTRTLHCWGRNDSGQLGYGTTMSYGRMRGQDTAPPAINLSTGGNSLRAVAVGSRHVCARTGTQSTGNLFCWGEGDNGRTGRNGTTDYGTVTLHLPLQPTLFEGAFPAIGAGDAHSCLVAPAGDAYACWGAGAGGRLGSGSTDDLGDNDREVPLPFLPAFYP